jgi:hypothetical protein
VRTALDTCVAFGGVAGIAPSRRTIETCMWGRERPSEGRTWGEEGGSEMGVAHAPLTAPLGCDSGADSRPAAQSAAGDRSEAADWQEDKASSIVQRANATFVLRDQSRCQPGNGAPDFWFPHPVPL